MAEMETEDSRKEFSSLLERMRRERGATASTLAILTSMCEIIERETYCYIKLDQDPFDDRHPARVDPDCNLGHLLTVLFNEDDFMNQLVTDNILLSRDFETNTVACRLLIDILPGLETSIIFEDTDGLVEKLVQWAREAEEPLRSYATGLLATAVEVQEVAANLREENASLVGVMMSRLHQLMQQDDASSRSSSSSKEERPFGCFGSAKEAGPNPLPGEDAAPGAPWETEEDETPANPPPATAGEAADDRTADDKAASSNGPAAESSPVPASHDDHPSCGPSPEAADASPLDKPDRGGPAPKPAASKEPPPAGPSASTSTSTRIRRCSDKGAAGAHPAPARPLARGKKASAAARPSKRARSSRAEQRRSERRVAHPDESNSSWSELSYFIIGTHQMHPLTATMQQRFILQYLTPLAEYQELLGTMFENGAMDIVMHYIDLQKSGDTRLTFDGLKYLSSLICHKKFAAEFVERGGVQQLLRVRRPSVAATGVSICLYYLAYNGDTMERICLLPGNVLSDLINYALWLLECSHESGRSHATMFFTMAFNFWAVIDHFDQQDGIRKLFNTMSTLNILNSEDQGILLNDDDVFASRQTVKHTCIALKRYFENHLAVRVDCIKRAYSKNQGLTPPDSNPPYKAIVVTEENNIEHMQIMLEEAPPNMHWKPVKVFLRMDGVKLMLQIIDKAVTWRNYSGRADAVRAAMDVLAVITVTTKGQLQLCEMVKVPEIGVGMGVVNSMAEGEVLQDVSVQKAALQVFINCVCCPVSKLGVTGGWLSEGNARWNARGGALRTGSDVTDKMRDCIRNNKGIRTLLNLLTIKSPITEADSMRALSCKALCGLARSEAVRQIVSKLPLFSSGQLQVLMKEPVLQDKQAEHLEFCRYASELIERVTGKPLGVDATLSKLHKANIVAQTKITYSQKELLQLIHCHLVSQGLTDTAGILLREANLPKCTSAGHSYMPNTLLTPAPLIPRPFHLQRAPAPLAPHITSTGYHHHHHAPPSPAPLPGPALTTGPQPHPPLPPLSVSVAPESPQGSQPHPPAPSAGGGGGAGSWGGSEPSPCEAHSAHSAPATPQQIGRISFGPDRNPTTPGSTITRVKKRIIREKVSQNALFNVNGVGGQPKRRQTPNPPSLDMIVSQYLREQHAHCSNPVVACPSFSLLEPHQCPEPRFRQNAPINATSRILRRAIRPMHGGVDGARCTRQFIYSRFRPMQTIYDGRDGKGCYTSCSFSKHANPNDTLLWLGNYQGKLKAYTMSTATEEASYNCHDSPLMHVEPSRDGQLILTCSFFANPRSALWGIGDTFEEKYTFQHDQHLEFGKLSQDRIIGTKEYQANIYDTATGKLILKLADAEMNNQYSKNCATFDPTDDLVLNDGVLWDVRSAKAIYKFDPFQNNISGMFHPSGLEIIINSEIWDVRTFHLLHTVPALNQCNIVFNTAGNVIYGFYQSDTSEDLDETLMNSFDSSFRTYDATDYKPIATIDVKKNIIDLATDPTDCYLAVLESQGTVENLNINSVCRVYEVGRPRKADGEEVEDEGDDDDEEDDGSDDDDDDDEFDVEDVLGGSDREEGGDGSDADDGADDDDDDDDDDDIDINSSGDSGSLSDLEMDSDDYDDNLANALFSVNSLFR